MRKNAGYQTALLAQPAVKSGCWLASRWNPKPLIVFSGLRRLMGVSAWFEQIVVGPAQEGVVPPRRKAQPSMPRKTKDIAICSLSSFSPVRVSHKRHSAAPRVRALDIVSGPALTEETRGASLLQASARFSTSRRDVGSGCRRSAPSKIGSTRSPSRGAERPPAQWTELPALSPTPR
jgi:hypothetical protein